MMIKEIHILSATAPGTTAPYILRYAPARKRSQGISMTPRNGPHADSIAHTNLN